MSRSSYTVLVVLLAANVTINVVAGKHAAKKTSILQAAVTMATVATT